MVLLVRPVSCKIHLTRMINNSSISAVCAPVCANGGTCTSPGVCSCVSGWSGTRCGTCKTLPTHFEELTGSYRLVYTLVVCTSACLNGGTCTGPNTCTCTAGRNGAVCQNCKCQIVFFCSVYPSLLIHALVAVSFLYIGLSKWWNMHWTQHVYMCVRMERGDLYYA